MPCTNLTLDWNTREILGILCGYVCNNLSHCMQGVELQTIMGSLFLSWVLGGDFVRDSTTNLDRGSLTIYWRQLRVVVCRPPWSLSLLTNILFWAYPSGKLFDISQNASKVYLICCHPHHPHWLRSHRN